MKARTCTSGLFLAALSLGPCLAPIAHAQTESYSRARRQQHYSDARHHTKAKVVGGSAAGGALIGALAGGGKGALIGAGAGAGAGLVANHYREKHDVHKREEYGTVHTH